MSGIKISAYGEGWFDWRKDEDECPYSDTEFDDVEWEKDDKLVLLRDRWLAGRADRREAEGAS